MSETNPDWPVLSLGKVANTQLGRMLSSRRETGIHAKPYLRNRDVQWGRINTENLPVMDFSACDSERYILRPGDVLVCEGGEVGRAAIWVGQISECYYQKALHRIRPSGDLLPQFLVYLLEYYSHTRAFEHYTSGSTIAHLPQEDLRNLPVPLPSVGEQQQIVAVAEEQFSRLDMGLALLRRAGLGVSRLKGDAQSLGSAEVDSWVTLGEIAEVIGGVTKDTKKQADPSFVEVPYLRVANVQRGYLDLAKITTIRVPAAAAHRLRLEPGDILFNEGGDRDKLGRGWIWEGQIPDCIHQNHVFRARLLNDDYDPRFISMHGNSFGRSWFEKNGKQTTNLASLSMTVLKSFPVPKVSADEQRAIVDAAELKLSILGALEEAIHAAEKRCRRLRAAILKAAFSGSLV